mmetsp:Transcript_30777/g.80593  ORF Transcript_30777/g.80593 Transcript_30777/m.80593 type:complete len:220 (-) Transcript_30777:1640-2299(-)
MRRDTLSTRVPSDGEGRSTGPKTTGWEGGTVTLNGTPNSSCFDSAEHAPRTRGRSLSTYATSKLAGTAKRGTHTSTSVTFSLCTHTVLAWSKYMSDAHSQSYPPYVLMHTPVLPLTLAQMLLLRSHSFTSVQLGKCPSKKGVLHKHPTSNTDTFACIADMPHTPALRPTCAPSTASDVAKAHTSTHGVALANVITAGVAVRLNGSDVIPPAFVPSTQPV